MSALAQIGLIITAVCTLVIGQGDERRGFPQIPFQTGRAEQSGAADRFYYLWMPQQPPHPGPMPNFPPHFNPHQQTFHQDNPLYFRNFPNFPSGNPFVPPPHPPPVINPPVDNERDPVIILMPPATTTTPPPPEQTPSNNETSSTTETNQQQESERSGLLFKSATHGFTNAHHYPFPIGLWTQYKKSVGIEQDLADDPSPINPRRFPLLLLQPNQMPFVSTQRQYPDWSYGRPHSGSMPTTLVRVSDSDMEDGTDAARNFRPDNRFQYFAVPLRSVLNQLNAEMENERV